MKKQNGRPIPEAIELQIQKGEERFHEATGDLEFFRREHLVDIDRLKRLRGYVWDPIWRRIRSRERIPPRTIRDLVLPARMADEPMKLLGTRMRNGTSQPGEIMTTLQDACVIYEKLVAKSQEAMYLRAVDRAVDRIAELRSDPGQDKRPAPRIVAKRLNDERLRHPDGGDWTGDRVVAIAVHLFPGRPAPPTKMSADDGVQRLIRRSTGQTRVASTEPDSYAPAFPIMKVHNAEPAGAPSKRIIDAVAAHEATHGDGIGMNALVGQLGGRRTAVLEEIRRLFPEDDGGQWRGPDSPLEAKSVERKGKMLRVRHRR